MSDSVDREYFARRVTEELYCGEQARHPVATAAHYELAFRYSLIAFEKAADSSVVPFPTLPHTRQRLAMRASARHDQPAVSQGL
jgi:hypothetical protein